jgi:D-lyxose ketol-isomerase
MRRSEINRLIRQAESLLADHRIPLPPFASWTPPQWHADRKTTAYCRAHQMGWDITDFGAGRFEERGLLLFCLRNGIQGDPAEKPYAEKMLIVREGQETPFHAHAVKMEDIIVRGGGTLIVEVFEKGENGAPRANPIEITLDGQTKTVRPHEPIRLRAGESITIPRRLFHRFYGEPGSGIVIAWEVSQVNDDLTDNIFLDPIGRFANIEDDEPPYRLLWNELPISP